MQKKNRNNNPYNALINHQRPAGGVGISRDVIGVYIVLLSLAVINNDAENWQQTETKKKPLIWNGPEAIIPIIVMMI